MKKNIFVAKRTKSRLFQLAVCVFLAWGSGFCLVEGRELSEYAQEYQSLLSQKVLPYWLETAVDLEHGGYLMSDNAARKASPATEKQLVSQARMIWGFSLAHRKGYSDAKHDYLAAARQGYEFLRKYFHDPDNGGYYWTTDVSGKPRDTRKIVYGESFAVYAFVEYYRASGDVDALNRAMELYRILQDKAYDAKNGGWIEHFERDWTPILKHENIPVEVGGLKSANTHLHYMEALTELYEAKRDLDVRKSLEEAVKINATYFYPPNAGESCFHRQLDWKPVTDPKSAGLSYGHNVEFAWLMARAEKVLGREPSWAHFEAHLDHALKYGYDHQRGGLYSRGFGDQPATDTDKIWWVEAEMMAVLTDALQHRQNPAYRAALVKLLDFVNQYQAEPKDGIWLDTVSAEGKPKRTDKAHNWKANYHDVRAMVKFIEEFSSDSNLAWPRSSRYLALEAKPGTWKANWIQPGTGIRADDINRVFYARKTFTTAKPESFRRVYVSADSRYKLWVNGIPVSRGPARFDPNHQRYDTLDLSSLIQPGTNVIAAEVIYWGPGGPIFQMSAQPALVLESEEIKTDKSWKVAVSEAHRSAGFPSVNKNLGYMAGNWLEKIDARRIPDGWQQLGFDDKDWQGATTIVRAEIWGEGDTRAPWKLQPRTFPALQEDLPVATRAIQMGTVKGGAGEPPFSQEVLPAGENPSLPCVIPGDGKIHYVVFDAGKLVTAYPVLDIEGPAGTAVEIMYAEAPSINRKKDRRDRLDGRRVEGYNDIYIMREGRQTFEPFIHRTFWYARVAVKADRPVTIHGLKQRWTSYAFPERGLFSCSDPLLNRIWEVGWYTARLCAHESYEDCPYYEQLQYVGDTRIQALVTYYLTGDPRLPANAIRHLDASRLPEGLTYSRYPSQVYQVIPGFSLYWVLMLDDYLLHTGDLELVRECAGGVHAVLRFFEKYRTDKGFIANVPYWNFHDWMFEDNGQTPASRENCTLSTLLYKGALDAGVRLYTALGDTDEAARFRKRSEAAARAINEHAWSEKEGLYLDGAATPSLSRHVNLQAILFGVADDARKERIGKRLFDDKALRDTTFYYAHYLHQAARALGQSQRILDDMARWKVMLDKGTSTWWENPGETRSDCHAWSSAPTAEFMQELLGVRPVEPGFRKVRIQPFTGSLAWAKGSVPTPQGNIEVSWKRQPGFNLEITVPAGIEAEVVLPSGKKETRGAGTHRFNE